MVPISTVQSCSVLFSTAQYFSVLLRTIQPCAGLLMLLRVATWVHQKSNFGAETKIVGGGVKHSFIVSPGDDSDPRDGQAKQNVSPPTIFSLLGAQAPLRSRGLRSWDPPPKMFLNMSLEGRDTDSMARLPWTCLLLWELKTKGPGSVFYFRY